MTVLRPHHHQGETYEATGPKEPMGRIHEIFGPCAKPYYTVRVEGTATQHQLVARYQTATKKLLEAEKVRQDKTRQDKTRQDKTRQGKTKGKEGRKEGREGGRKEGAEPEWVGCSDDTFGIDRNKTVPVRKTKCTVMTTTADRPAVEPNKNSSRTHPTTSSKTRPSARAPHTSQLCPFSVPPALPPMPPKQARAAEKKAEADKIAADIAAAEEAKIADDPDACEIAAAEAAAAAAATAAAAAAMATSSMTRRGSVFACTSALSCAGSSRSPSLTAPGRPHASTPSATATSSRRAPSRSTSGLCRTRRTLQAARCVLRAACWGGGAHTLGAGHSNP